MIRKQNVTKMYQICCDHKVPNSNKTHHFVFRGITVKNARIGHTFGFVAYEYLYGSSKSDFCGPTEQSF